MGKILVSLAALSLLSGCVTLGAIGSKICDRQETARAALLLALENSDSPPKRAAIRASLEALEECPQNAR